MQGENTSGDGKALCKGGKRDKAEIAAIVAQADVIAQPRAVMVKPSHAVIAGGTMAATWGTPYTTGVAELEGDGPATKNDHAFTDGREGRDGCGESGGARDDARVSGRGEIGGQNSDGEGEAHGDEQRNADQGSMFQEPRKGEAAFEGEDGKAEYKGENGAAIVRARHAQAGAPDARATGLSRGRGVAGRVSTHGVARDAGCGAGLQGGREIEGGC